jgi:hypothetical protein
MERKLILTVGEDGLFFAHKIDYDSLVKLARGESSQNFSYPELSSGLSETIFSDKIELFDDT